MIKVDIHNWQTKKLGEIGIIFNGNSINERVKKEKYLNLDNGYPFIATKDVDFETHFINYNNGIRIPFVEKSFKIAHKDSVLICAEGGSAGRKIAFNGNDICFGNKLFAIETKEDINPKLVYYWYLTPDFFDSFKSQMNGIIGGVSIGNFKNLEIPLPPLPEQHRIVKILDEVFENIKKAKKNTEKNIQNSKELFESYSQSIFLDKENKWDKKKLDEICIVKRGSSPRPIKKYITDSAVGVNWIKIGDTKNVDRYLCHTNQKITKNGAEKSQFVKDGDLILSNSMSFGKPYIMKTTGYIHDGWFVLRPNPNLDTEYFYDVISSPLIQGQFISLASGAVVKNISGDLTKKVILPIPPLPEQKSIVARLDALSSETKKLEAIYKQKLADLEELKKSVLQKAFSGEL